jgi:hypothetical protein
MKILMNANCNLYLRDYRGNTPEEFIQRYMLDPNLYQEYVRNKYRQILDSAVNFSEVKNNFHRDKLFVTEMMSFYYNKYSRVLPIIEYLTVLFLLLITHWYFKSASDGPSAFGTIFGLLFYAMIFICLTLFIWFLNAELKIIPKKDVDDHDSIVQTILKQIDDGEFSKIAPLKEICFDTNIRKIKHAEYCEKSDSYLIEYQKY